MNHFHHAIDFASKGDFKIKCVLIHSQLVIYIS